MSLDGAFGYPEALGNFLVSEAAKKLQDHHARPFGCHPFQLFQSFVNEENFFIRSGTRQLEVQPDGECGTVAISPARLPLRREGSG